MPLAQIIARLGTHQNTQSDVEARALLLDNLRTAEDCALLARRHPDRRTAFLAIAKGAYSATLTY